MLHQFIYHWSMPITRAMCKVLCSVPDTNDGRKGGPCPGRAYSLICKAASKANGRTVSLTSEPWGALPDSASLWCSELPWTHCQKLQISEATMPCQLLSYPEDQPGWLPRNANLLPTAFSFIQKKQTQEKNNDMQIIALKQVCRAGVA